MTSRRSLALGTLLLTTTLLLAALAWRHHQRTARGADRADQVARNRPSGYPAGLPVWTYRVVNTYPHDPQAFTQGLVFHDGKLYESVGLRGRSEIRELALETGEVIKKVRLDSEVFGEGLALTKNTLIQLTWTDEIAYRWSPDNLSLLGRIPYDGKAWGLTSHQEHLLMSDGTSTLSWRDPETLNTARKVEVRAGKSPLRNLNELEMVGEELFANIWMTNFLARIDPESGEVLGWVDLSGLLTSQEAARADVLNGIAYDPKGKRLFITGKLWPKLFELTLHEGAVSE